MHLASVEEDPTHMNIGLSHVWVEPSTHQNTSPHESFHSDRDLNPYGEGLSGYKQNVITSRPRGAPLENLVEALRAKSVSPQLLIVG